MSDDIIKRLREALAAGPTPGEWACYDDSNDGKTSRIEIVAIGKTVARIYRSVPEQDLPNARLIAACSPANMTAILAHVKAQEAEIERLTAERDDHARWRADLADKLHDRETTISAAWEALRSAGVHSEATIDDGIRLLRRQLAEAELDAERYRWLAGHCRSTSEHWGGRWSIIVDGPAPKAHDSEDAFDAAIDAAMRLTRPAEE